LLTAAEHRQLFVEWNDTRLDYERERTLPEFIEVQAARWSAATALIHETTRLSYGELNRRANQLARHLRQRGVGPDTLVGICLERTWQLPVALLAVMLVLYGERRARGAVRPVNERPRGKALYHLKGGQAWAASAWCGLVFACGFVIPLLQLIAWFWQRGRFDLDERYSALILHTVYLGAMAALITVSVALLLAFARRLAPTRLMRSPPPASMRSAAPWLPWRTLSQPTGGRLPRFGNWSPAWSRKTRRFGRRSPGSAWRSGHRDGGWNAVQPGASRMRVAPSRSRASGFCN
jgi:hypothetical protein